MAPPAPRVVCFDLGGVVVRICRSFEEAILAAGLALRPLPSDDWSHAAQRDVVARHQLGWIHGPDFFAGLATAMRDVYSADELVRIHRAVLRAEYDGVTELIAGINRAGLVTACLSNTNHDHWTELVEMPSLRLLHARHASHLWGLAKPNAAIYERFERELAVTPASILFFDDLRENVAAAQARGWDAVKIDHAGNTAAQMGEALAARGVVIGGGASTPPQR